MMQNALRLRSAVHKAGAVFAVVGAAVAIAACGSSSNSSASSSSGGSSAAAAGSGSSSTTAAKNNKHLTIAYLSFAVQNSYDAPMLAAAQAVAASNNATLKVFDANNSPTTQYSQFQDVITQGGYDGVITQPIESTNLIPLVKQASAKGIKVVNIDQILGPKLNTDADQAPGLSGNVAQVPTIIGHDLGVLTVQACAAKHYNPCKVGYLFDIKASALDVALRSGFDAATKGSPVKVVEEGQDFFTPAGGLKAVQQMMSADPSIQVISGTDQGIEGAAQDPAIKGKVTLVGYGGSAAGIAGVKAGTWYGTVVELPATEGRVGMQELIDAIREGKTFKGVNPYAGQLDGGLITKKNVSHFTGQWPG